LRNNIKKIADYIGEEINQELLDAIVESSTFRHMKTTWKPEDVSFFREQKTSEIYRKGEKLTLYLLL